MSNFDFTPQGWECPKCKRVYSPTTIMCVACPSMTGSTSNSTTTSTGTDSSMIFTSCVFEPGGTINGFYYPDFCRKCGKEKQYHKYDKYNTPKL